MSTVRSPMPRTKGCSCCASQMAAAVARSSALKLTQQRVPVQHLVALKQACRPPHQPRRHPALEACRDDRGRSFLEAGRGLCEEVEEADLLRVEAVALGQGTAEPATVLAQARKLTR